MVEKPHPNMAASKEDYMAQGTKTGWWRRPTWLSLPPAVSVPWDWHCLGQLPTCGVNSSASLWPAGPSCFGHCSSDLLLLCGERKPTCWALKPTPGPNSSSSALWLHIAKFPLKQFWIEKTQFLGDLCSTTSLASQQETRKTTLCACSLSLKGIL